MGETWTENTENPSRSGIPETSAEDGDPFDPFRLPSSTDLLRSIIDGRGTTAGKDGYECEGGVCRKVEPKRGTDRQTDQVAPEAADAESKPAAAVSKYLSKQGARVAQSDLKRQYDSGGGSDDGGSGEGRSDDNRGRVPDDRGGSDGRPFDDRGSDDRRFDDRSDDRRGFFRRRRGGEGPDWRERDRGGDRDGADRGRDGDRGGDRGGEGGGRDGLSPADGLKEKYTTAEAEQAIKLAAEKNLPLVVHVGARWCGPCRAMESGVWPTIESEMRGKAVFLHVDGDQARAGVGGQAAADLAGRASGYPTVMFIKPGAALEPQFSQTGGMSLNQVREFIGRGLR